MHSRMHTDKNAVIQLELRAGRILAGGHRHQAPQVIANPVVALLRFGDGKHLKTRYVRLTVNDRRIRLDVGAGVLHIGRLNSDPQQMVALLRTELAEFGIIVSRFLGTRIWVRVNIRAQRSLLVICLFGFLRYL